MDVLLYTCTFSTAMEGTYNGQSIVTIKNRYEYLARCKEQVLKRLSFSFLLPYILIKKFKHFFALLVKRIYNKQGFHHKVIFQYFNFWLQKDWFFKEHSEMQGVLKVWVGRDRGMGKEKERKSWWWKWRGKTYSLTILTSARRILRKAFAMAASTPIMSNSNSSPCNLIISTLNFCNR